LRAVVFLRNDIYQHLILDPADRGKETAALLDWKDPEALKEMVRRRIYASTGHDLPFDDLWRMFFTSHVNGEDSFSYILGGTLMRPRELLRFTRDCLNVAVNRRHEHVQEEDILHVEKSFSDDALVDLALELKDVNAGYANAPYGFIGLPAHLRENEVDDAIVKGGINRADTAKVRELLLWFGFIGISTGADDDRYSFQFEHNLRKMRSGLGDGSYSYCVNPAFRESLGCMSF
jgi:hypothetical protein